MTKEMRKSNSKLKNGGYKHSKYVCTNCKQKRLRNARINLISARAKKLKAINLKRFASKNGEFQPKRDDRLEQYTVYSIVNYGFFSNKGNLITAVARGFLRLYRKVERDRYKNQALDEWEEDGSRMVVLKGCNHKHLCFLAEGLRYAATSTHGLYQTWGRSQLMLVLSVLGKEEDLEPYFDGITELR